MFKIGLIDKLYKYLHTEFICTWYLLPHHSLYIIYWIFLHNLTYCSVFFFFGPHWAVCIFSRQVPWVQCLNWSHVPCMCTQTRPIKLILVPYLEFMFNQATHSVLSTVKMCSFKLDAVYNSRKTVYRHCHRTFCLRMQIWNQCFQQQSLNFKHLKWTHHLSHLSNYLHKLWNENQAKTTDQCLTDTMWLNKQA